MIYMRLLFCLLFVISGCTQSLTQPSPLGPAPPSVKSDRAQVYYEYMIAQSYVNEKQFDKAIEAYEKALQIDPQSPVLLTELALIYLRQGNIDSALKLAEQSILSAPDYAPSYLLLGQLYASTGQIGPAVKAYRRVIELNPSEEDDICCWAPCMPRKNVSMRPLRFSIS